MLYELANDPAYTAMVARHLTDLTEADRMFYRSIAGELGCDLSNVVGCIGLLFLERSGAAVPTEIYRKLFDQTPERTAFFANIRSQLTD